MHAGKATGKALPQVFAAAGFATAEGKTFNVDDNDQYSPGFVQTASATHFVWQAGAGVDYQLGEPGPNLFGFDATQVQFGIARRL